MAKLPDSTALGGAPNLNSGRPIANIDQSAIGQGVAKLGQGIANAGEGVSIYARAQDDLESATLRSKFETEMVGLNSRYDQDQDFATRKKRYEDDVTKLRSGVAEGASPRVAETFRLHTDPIVARSIEQQKDISFKLKTDNDIASLHTDGNTAAESIVGTTDRDARVRMIEIQKEKVRALVQQGSMSQTAAVDYMTQWGRKVGLADGMARVDAGDGEAVINDARAEPGSMSEIANRVVQVESGGDPRARAKTTSAFGAAQFLATSKSDQTWLQLVKEFRPDLADGKSIAEIDDMRADPNLSKEMLGKLLEKNKGILSRQGVEPTPAALYLSHFLGPKSAIAVLKANPNRPVSDVLSEAVGPDFARQMVEANMSVLAGRQAGSVAQWAATRMGGADRGSIYRILGPEEKRHLINYAEGVLHKQTVDDFAQFKQRVTDTESEAGATGNVLKPIGQWEFISRLGFEQGKQAFERHAANVQLGQDAATIANMDPEQRGALVQKYQPQPGAPGFADQEKRLETLIRADQKISKEKQDDVARFAVTRLPAVQDKYKAFLSATSMADKQAAARTYADTSLMEQARIGIPAADRRIVSNDYVDNLIAAFANQPAAGGPSNIAAQIEKERQIWGDEHWPAVYQDIVKKKAGAVVEVLGSGIKPDAAKILVDNQAISAHKILGVDETDTKAKDINKAVRTVMVPFANSTLGHDGRSRVLDVYQGQIEKLAAHYVANADMTADDAAKTAFEKVMGFKYEFRDSYRVPAKQHDHPAGVDINVISAGAWHAKTLIGEGKFAIEPATNDMRGPLSKEYLTKEAERAYARDGVWVTAPDEKGLALIYNGAPVPMRDGKPLTLSWKDLEEIANVSPLRRRGANEGRGTTGELARRIRENYGQMPSEAAAPQRVAGDGADIEASNAEHFQNIGRIRTNQAALDAWEKTGPWATNIEDRRGEPLPRKSQERIQKIKDLQESIKELEAARAARGEK